MYEDRTQDYDPEIHEEYLIHDTLFLLQTTAYLKLKHNWKATIFCCDYESKIWIFRFFLQT